MSKSLSFERTLIVAPHPDDDVIAAGGLIQRVVAQRGKLCVAFVTDGENNPWPQRFMERRILIRDSDRARWGAMRRQEALASLQRFGVMPDAARFLGFPDQKIASMARRGDDSLRHALRTVFDEFQPTLIVSPSALDLHADHRAISYFVHRAAADDVSIATYVVHGRPRPSRLFFEMALSAAEQRQKRAAIECHESQLYLSRARFLAHVRPVEAFLIAEDDLAGVESHVESWSYGLRQVFNVIAGSFGSKPAAVAPIDESLPEALTYTARHSR